MLLSYFKYASSKLVFLERQKFLNFEPKMLTLGICGLEFGNIFVILEISLLDHVLIQSFVQKIVLKFRTINFWFGYFSAGIWKCNCHIWNQHPQICLIPEFGLLIKMLKFQTKMHSSGIFEMEFENNFVMFETSTLEFV